MDRYCLDRYPFISTPCGGVFRCTDRVTGDRLVAKLVYRRGPSGERRARQLIRGAELAAQCGPHAHLLWPHAICLEADRAVLVMPYVGGGTLLDRLLSRGPMSEAAAAKLSAELLRAVAHLHRGGVMHRDIKADNVLLDGDAVRLGDFGFAVPIGPNTACVASPPYCAPEVAAIALSQDKPHRSAHEALHTYDERCDVWSVGVVVYVTLSARFPFAEGTPREVFERVCRAEFGFPGETWRGVSALGMDFVRQLMCADPTRRLTAQGALLHPWLAKV